MRAFLIRGMDYSRDAVYFRKHGAVEHLRLFSVVEQADKARGWILYDGACSMCTGLAGRFESMLKRKGFVFVPFQEQWVQERLGLGPNKSLAEMKVLTADGHLLGGADAIVFLARTVWWGWPFYLAAQLPGMMILLRKGYRWIAQRRHPIGGVCVRPVAPQWPGWVPIAVFPLLAAVLRSRLPAWGFMWALSFAIYFGCKWLTWWKARTAAIRSNTARVVGYLLAWPGMDPYSFLNLEARPSKPAATSWVMAIFKTAIGAVIFWGLARQFPPQEILIRGWIGMFGLIFLLHFGSFHIVALFWQAAGVDARPIMQSPVLATSLSDFWGNRWNLGFRQLSYDLVFQPARGRLGVAGATLLSFLSSGLIHEMVISLPAGADYGFPTGYFVLQGIGVIIERSTIGKQFGLNRGLPGWLFTFFFTAGPAFWLFHPPFVTKVIIPFMVAMGAL